MVRPLNGKQYGYWSGKPERAGGVIVHRLQPARTERSLDACRRHRDFRKKLAKEPARLERMLKQLSLGGLFLLWLLKAGVVALRELVLEFLDTASGINKLQFAGIERMASVADINLQLFRRTSGREFITATTANARHVVLGVALLLHRSNSCL